MFLFCNRCICINCKKITAVKMLPSIINKHCEMRNYTEANAQQYFLYYTNPTSTLFALNKYGITMSSTLLSTCIITFQLDVHIVTRVNKSVTYFFCQYRDRDVRPKQALNLILFLASHLHIVFRI